MRFTFDAEQLALRDAVRALLAKECTPAHVRDVWDTQTGRSPQRWRALAEMGALGATVTEAHGGMGLDDTWTVLLFEEAGRAALPEPLGPVSVAATLLAQTAPPDVCEQWLPRIAAGDAIVTAALPGQRWVDDVHTADLVLVADGDDLHGIAAGDLEPVLQPSLDRSRRQFAITPRTSDATRIATGVGAAIAAAHDRLLMSRAATLLGTARVLVEMGTRYATEREQFGAPIGSFQAVKHHLATAAVRAEFAAPAVYRAAWSCATDAVGRTEHAAMAHTLAAQAAHLAARTALQVHGAIGYTDEHDLHLWLRSALNPAAARPGGLG
jgi:alkylation response protein AidB-like acyl-CoA dehydrogenase